MTGSKAVLGLNNFKLSPSVPFIVKSNKDLMACVYGCKSLNYFYSCPIDTAI